ncbi:MAG: tRNA uridine-5-carboxymethylaminomethyl(34) synthesis GTPase MnmE [Clostridia bacterium]|nr:tRNA uridine-5-carboxymethylaminomethyl(34) synthesis GTPase MnmE [Clostridia bacterium]
MITDTIAAISTPYGKGGVALIRVSGERAVEIAARVFLPMSGNSLAELDANYMAYGRIVDAADGGVPVDDGMAVVFRAPHSFTGEDTVEITCHGGILVTQTVLTCLLAAGARPAEPGEFTKRAFINGKLGLSAAEALGNLLEAGTREQMLLSGAGMRGGLSKKTNEIYEGLCMVLSSIFARIDYPDEDLADMSREQMREALCDALEKNDALIATYRTGHAVAEGIPTVICGRANSGKSSLYNRIVGREAAIVTDIAGTTRDVLTETAAIGRVTVRLHDTAGLRESDDRVEQIGVQRALEHLESAELVLAVFDACVALTEEDDELLERLKHHGGCVIGVINKTDAASPEQVHALQDMLADCVSCTVCLSAMTGEGFDALVEAVNQTFIDGKIDLSHDAVVANARQHAALIAARERICGAVAAVDMGLPVDLCCSDVEQAAAAIAEVDGREVSEDVVAGIFAHFCVGK